MAQKLIFLKTNSKYNSKLPPNPSSLGERRYEANERAATRKNEKQRSAGGEETKDAADAADAAADVAAALEGKTRNSKKLKKELQKWMKKALEVYAKLTDYVWRILELHIFKVRGDMKEEE